MLWEIDSMPLATSPHTKALPRLASGVVLRKDPDRTRELVTASLVLLMVWTDMSPRTRARAA